MGISFLVPERDRLPQLNTIYIPEGADDALVRQRLLTEFDLEIGSGLGALAGKVWRIGLMGHGSSEKNVTFCLNSLKAVL